MNLPAFLNFHCGATARHHSLHSDHSKDHDIARTSIVRSYIYTSPTLSSPCSFVQNVNEDHRREISQLGYKSDETRKIV